MSHHNAEFLLQQHAKCISRSVEQIGAVYFFNLLTGAELLEMTDSLLPEHREQLFPPTLALSMFMGEVLSEDGSCQKAVDSWAAQRAVEDYPLLSSQVIGVGSPLARLVGAICLSTGALIHAAMGPFTGKGTSELGLLTAT